MEGEDYGYAAFFETVDTLVTGCGTYDKVLTFGGWPHGPKHCIVMKQRAATAISNEEFYSGNPSNLVQQLTRGSKTHQRRRRCGDP